MTKSSLNKKLTRGFTLVELIIVIAVIGVLAAILIPVFANVVKKANAQSALADARNAVSQYVTEMLERRALSNVQDPENIVIIVSKGGYYYLFGFNTDVSEKIKVSSANENGLTANDVNDLIDRYSWNSLTGTEYNPETMTNNTADDGYFYLVPYNYDSVVGFTSSNSHVRGIGTADSTGEHYYRIDSVDTNGYGIDMDISRDACFYHGCLIDGTYDTESSTPNNSTGSGDTTPPAPTSYSVSFTTTGIDSADLANVVYKKGSQVLSNPATLTEGTGVGTLTAECPVATSAYSYTFTGATASNGHSTIDEADMTITFAFTKVMAQTYNVTYNANGGSGTMTDNTDYLTNAVITLPENTFTAPEHKHFTGWLINNTGELRAAGYQFNITADTEIYAQWGDDAQISVHFNSNGGTGTMEDVSVYAGSYTLPECTFTKTHYHFNGWKANNTGATLGATYNVTEEVTFYATWEQDATYTITYNGNGATGGTAPTDSNSYYSGDSATLAANTFTYTHKHFTGWKVENGGALLAAGSSYTITGNVTMYAQWEDDPTYTVTYNKNTEDTVTGMPSNDTGVYAGTHTLNSTATPTRTGYDFMGWATSSGSTTTVSQITVSGNTTVYAVWQIKSFAVTFTDGTNSQNKSYNYNTTITLADENPLTAPSGKELDKFTVDGADATTLTVTAATTVTVVWKNQAAAGVDCTFRFTYANYNGNGPFYGNDWSIATYDYVKNCTPGEVTITMDELVAAGSFAPDMNGKYYLAVEQGTTKNYITEWTFTVVEGTTLYTQTVYTIPKTGTRPSTNIINPTAIIPVPYEDR